MIAFIENLNKYLPLIFQYYLPGYVFFKIVSINSDSVHKDNTFFIIEVIVSFILVSIVQYICPTSTEDIYRSTLLSLTIAVALSLLLLYSYKKNHSIAKNFFRFLGFSHENSIALLVNLNIGAFARITINEKITNENLTIAGKVFSFDNGTEPKFITLVDYQIVNKKGIDESMIAKHFSFFEDREYRYMILPMNSIVFLEIVEPTNQTLR